MKETRVSYSYWKTLVDSNGWDTYWVDKGGSVKVISGTRSLIVWSLASDSDKTNWENNYKSDATEVVTFGEARLRLTGGTGVVNQRTKGGKQVQSNYPNTTKHTNIKSFNFADPTSWFEQAVHVQSETHDITSSTSTVDLNNDKIINATQGNIHDEMHITDDNGYDYAIDVWVNGTKKSEEDFHTGNGDYSVDYQNGTLTFNNALSDGDTVEVDYHHADLNSNSDMPASMWHVEPEDGKKLDIVRAELQSTADLNMLDSMRFEIGYYDANGNWVNIQDPNVYKTWHDVLIESNGAMPQYQPPSSPDKRDLQKPVDVFQWDYTSTITLKSSQNICVRIYNEHDVPHDGNYLTVTLYCLVEDE